nr:hypothetical protein [uncultured Actinoplanes sp.]
MRLRRHTVLAASVLAAAALTAGCSIEISPDAVPVPISIAPTPSESAGVPKYVCSAVYKVLTDGAVRLALDSAKSGDEAVAGMHRTFTDMAAKVDAEAARTTDTGLKQALATISASLTEGATQSDPRAYVKGPFETVSQNLDGHCD